MNTNLPISQADLEAMRIGSAHAADEMEWMITVDAVSGHLQATTDSVAPLSRPGYCRAPAMFSRRQSTAPH